LQSAADPRLHAPLPRAARHPILAALATDLPGPHLFLVARQDRALTAAEEIKAWAPHLQVEVFPEPNPLFYEPLPWGPRTLRSRIRILSLLSASHQPGIPSDMDRSGRLVVVASVRAAMTRTLPPRLLLAHSRILKVGNTIQLDRLLRLLVDIGYQPQSLVTEAGQFSRRGGILDIWPPAEAYPVRIELFGDEIDSMRTFDPQSQRSREEIQWIRLSPSREALPKHYQAKWDSLQPESAGEGARPLLEFFLAWMYDEHRGLVDYFPEHALLAMDDRSLIEDTLEDLEQQALEMREQAMEEGRLKELDPRPYLTLEELSESFEGHKVVDFGLQMGDDRQIIELGERFAPGPRFGGQLKPWLEHIGDCRMRHETVIVVSRQAQRLAELSARQGTTTSVRERVPEQIVPGDLVFLQGALAEGWQVEARRGERLHLLTDAEIFGWARPRPRPRTRVRSHAPESAFADLSPGDLVVHADFGIGRFLGLVEHMLEGVRREFLEVEFADGAQLYVPIHQADRLTRYVGADGRLPTLSRLGAQDWKRTKSKVRQAVEEVARDLLDLYARRMTIPGHAFSPDSAWQRELEASFPYVETEDQVRVLQAVKHDMEQPRPMDRLICGDVGYGKTEVALRAAFKAVMDGKQVAVLVPTTVLAQQHYNTFRQRLAAFPVQVEMLSRFRSPAETRQILAALKRGEIDIVIGTHRLLQPDVEFKDLGLLIIDEEQRFGVTHKEYLKKKRTEVDVLTMTATPIPRTLYLALTGARDISTLNTPPDERLPVITHVGPYDSRLVRQAILRELDRGGQVFFVHNRVRTIKAVYGQLKRLVPEAEIAVAHGQMPEAELAQVMERFAQGEIDVLLTTSIIESGLDFPNANTLIVDRADQFGLAQLYQLRGRVGRGAQRAYAYFFRHPSRRISEPAAQRLETIATHTALGSGYAIAMQDLELRGAGDILGTRQHGHISAVGFHLYTRLLASAVRRLRHTYRVQAPMPQGFPQVELHLPVTVDLPLSSLIPEEYVADRDLRLQLYRRMAEIRSLEALQALRSELEDRFGPPPSEVENLLYQLKVRILAARAQVESISLESGQLLLRPAGTWDPARLLPLDPLLRASKKGLWFAYTRADDWRSRLTRLLERWAERQEGVAESAA